MVNDLTKGYSERNLLGFGIECLGDANIVYTCLANDFSYDDIYSLQLHAKGKAGDLLVYFSGSGNSPNLVRAAEVTRELNMQTIGFLGAMEAF